MLLATFWVQQQDVSTAFCASCCPDCHADQLSTKHSNCLLACIVMIRYIPSHCMAKYLWSIWLNTPGGTISFQAFCLHVSLSSSILLDYSNSYKYIVTCGTLISFTIRLEIFFDLWFHIALLLDSAKKKRTDVMRNFFWPQGSITLHMNPLMWCVNFTLHFACIHNVRSYLCAYMLC